MPPPERLPRRPPRPTAVGRSSHGTRTSVPPNSCPFASSLATVVAVKARTRIVFFPSESKRWGYYVLAPKVHPSIRQPSGWWCWECDALCERQPEDKSELRRKLASDPEYKQVWNDEWIPKQRHLIKQCIARGDDRLPRQAKRVATHEQGSESRVFIPGTWIEEKIPREVPRQS